MYINLSSPVVRHKSQISPVVYFFFIYFTQRTEGGCGGGEGGRHAEAVRETVDILIKVLTAFLCVFFLHRISQWTCDGEAS